MIFCKVLYISGDDGAPVQSREIVVPFEYMVEAQPMPPAARCEIRGVLEQIGGYVVDGDQLEIRAVAGIYVTGYVRIDMEMIDDAEEEPFDDEALAHIPSMTGYVVASGDTLWDIAKRYGTTIDKIRQYNDNVEDPLEPGRKLFLIKSVEEWIGG